MEVLVVDDEPQLSELMAEYLADCGYKATCAGNVSQALKLIKARRFSVVVSDITMPGPSGLELLQAVQRVSPETCVILITGSANSTVALEALRQGAFAVMQKPFSLQELKEKLEEAARKGLGKAQAPGAPGPKHLDQATQARFLPLNKTELQLIDSMGAALALVDSHGTVLGVNQGFFETFPTQTQRTTGIVLCKALDCSLASQPPCPNPCEMWDRLQRAITEERSSGPFLCSVPISREGKGRHSLFHTRILVLPDENGSSPQNKRLAVLMEDVSEILDAEAQVLDSGCLGCLGEITRDLVHELAQPLNAISAHCQLLKFRIQQQGEASREVVLSSLEELQKQTNHMTKVLNHLRSGYRTKLFERQGEPHLQEKLLTGSKDR